MSHNRCCERVCAAEHAPRDPFHDGDEEGADCEEVGVGRAAAWLRAADSISPFFLSVEPLLRRFPFLPE